MEIKSVSTIPFPREEVFRTYRDRLVDLVPYLPNVEKVEVRSREEIPPHIVKLENVWYAKGEVPKVAQGLIKPEYLRWIDRATWNSQEYSIMWEFETFFLREAVHVKGKNFMTEIDGGRTQFHIHGDLDLDLGKVPGVPRFLAGTIKPQVEKFIVALLTPNLTTINKGLEEFLSRQQRQA